MTIPPSPPISKPITKEEKLLKLFERYKLIENIKDNTFHIDFDDRNKLLTKLNEIKDNMVSLALEL